MQPTIGIAGITMLGLWHAFQKIAHMPPAKGRRATTRLMMMNGREIRN
jgi:hypothetical protein